jgi:Ni/Fe-hydrogenase subunit HybB-like protein
MSSIFGDHGLGAVSMKLRFSWGITMSTMATLKCRTMVA